MNYIGSKHSLLPFIQEVVESLNIEKDNAVICDIFSGTSAVGKHFKKLGYSIISNDIQHFSFVTAKVFVENNKELTWICCAQWLTRMRKTRKSFPPKTTNNPKNDHTLFCGRLRA